MMNDGRRINQAKETLRAPDALPGKKRIAILGSTGSVGENAVRVARASGDDLQVYALAAGSNVRRLAEQAAELHASFALVADETRFDELKRLLPDFCTPLAGKAALCELMQHEALDLVLCAIVGTGGLLPVMEAIKSGKEIALASKEVMVMAGRLVTELAQKNRTTILPVDSEHSAIFQCLEGRAPDDVASIILTASGGPFRNASREEMETMSWAQALAHPTWSMGPKVTIDSASLMNKALEMVEARWLFQMPEERIEVLIHPQSIVHSMLRFRDGALLAHLSVPDMRFPIQYAFSHPHRRDIALPPLDLTKLSGLTFEQPDAKRFPSLDFARFALRSGHTMPAVMNAANEIAVERFKNGEIAFTDIWKIIENTISSHNCLEDSRLDAILIADEWARRYARNIKV